MEKAFSKLVDFNIFWGSMPPDLPTGSPSALVIPHPSTLLSQPPTAKLTESTAIETKITSSRL